MSEEGEEVPLLSVIMDNKLSVEEGEAGLNTEHLEPQPSTTTKTKEAKAPPRYELQGLRAVAIIAVLLFHCWQKTFTTGYLGVDVFFIISGYLMCHLLSRRLPLTAESILDFYFRRIKRIVLTYLFVIAISLIVAKEHISRLDFHQLIEEAVPAIFFYSNLPFVHQVGYFDLKSKHEFFLHTWSLSTEMQFYLVVPVLFLIAQKLSRPSLVFTFGALLFVLSFLRQCFAEGVAKHMPLDGRIWQFMSGFAAHFLFEWGTLKVSDQRMLKLSEDYPWVGKLGQRLLDTAVNILLAVLLLVAFTSNKQLERLVVILVGTIFVSLPNNGKSILSTNALVALGDASYSVYLIHWPIFTLHRFLNEKMYEDNKDPPHVEGFYLITISIISGYVVEKITAQVIRRVKSWRSLLALMLGLYIGIAVILLQIDNRAITVDLANIGRSDEWLQRVTDHTMEFWAERKHPEPLTPTEALEANLEYTDYSFFNGGCQHRHNVTLPTKFNYERRELGKYCHEKLNGTKTVVIIGNSHAYHTYLGIRHHFRDIASTLSMFSWPACVPVPEADQPPFHGRERMRKCVHFMKETIEVVKQWETPVDIIITLFGYHMMSNPPPVENWETDPMFSVMQNYFSEVNNAAREAVFISLMTLEFRKKQVKALADHLLADLPIGEFGESKSKQLRYLNEIRHRLEKVECDKCIKMNWHKLWCTADNGRFCQTVEPARGIAYFLDNTHVTPYGSLIAAEAMKHRYRNFLKNH